MTAKKMLHHFAVGLVIGMLLIPSQPVHAQWTVFDPSQYALQVKKRLEELNRWVETARHYQDMYTKAVENLTTVRGVLKTVDKQLFKNQQAALLANDIGKIINNSQRLRRRLEGMVKYQVRSLKSIDDRLSQGVFDPDADLRDLQNYLLYTMGRDARQTVDRMMRTARADAQLAAWNDQRSALEFEKATLSTKLEELSTKLSNEDANDLEAQRNIQHLNEMISQAEKQIGDVEKGIQELTEKINDRIREHGLRLQDMENFAYQVDSTNEMWKEFQKTKIDLQKTMDSLILGTTPPTAK